jgi:hypothetical protein
VQIATEKELHGCNLHPSTAAGPGPRDAEHAYRR